MKIIANGKEYIVKESGYVYLDDKRVSKEMMMNDLKKDIRNKPLHDDTEENEVLERVEQNTQNKGIKMTYTDKLNLFGISREALERKVGKVAYKPMNEYNGKEYAGSYLINLNGKTKVVSELTYEGKLQMFDVNTRTLGFYMPDLFNIAETKQIGEFESIRPATLDLDDLGTVDEPEQLIDIISIWRVQFADLDIVTFLNESTGNFMGTKLYQVYKAEQEARLKPVDLDTAFELAMKEQQLELEGELGEDKQSA